MIIRASCLSIFVSCFFQDYSLAFCNSVFHHKTKSFEHLKFWFQLCFDFSISHPRRNFFVIVRTILILIIFWKGHECQSLWMIKWSQCVVTIVLIASILNVYQIMKYKVLSKTEFIFLLYRLSINYVSPSLYTLSLLHFLEIIINWMDKTAYSQSWGSRFESAGSSGSIIVPLGKALYPHCLVPRKGLKAVGSLVTCL